MVKWVWSATPPPNIPTFHPWSESLDKPLNGFRHDVGRVQWQSPGRGGEASRMKSSRDFAVMLCKLYLQVTVTYCERNYRYYYYYHHHH